MACFPDFLSQKVGSARICADVTLLASVGSDLLANPDELFGRPDCKIIKDQRKIKVGRIDLLIDGVSTGVYLKRYNAFSARYRMGSLVLSSGAVKSVRGAEVLSRAGISTAPPLASIERRSWGMLNSSFFLSKEIIRGKTADAYWHENLTPMRGAEGFRHRRRFLKALARLFVGLHEHGIYHNDLKDANILVHDGSSGEHFALLDVEGVRHCWYLSRRRRVKNMVQLNRTLGNFLTRTAKVFFLNSYLGQRSVEYRTKRRWIGDVLHGTQKARGSSLTKTVGRASVR